MSLLDKLPKEEPKPKREPKSDVTLKKKIKKLEGDKKELLNLLKKTEDEVQQLKTKNAELMHRPTQGVFQMKLTEIDELKEKLKAAIEDGSRIPVPEFNDIIQFCRQHRNDIECAQFLKHCDPNFARKRRGGGWSGSVKCLLAIQRKMMK